MKYNKGISLIILVITIIAVILLSCAIVLNIINNNPISKDKEAKFKQNVESYISELNTVVSNKHLDLHTFDPTTFNVVAWDGNDNNVENTIKEYITKITSEDGPKFKIIDSKLIYIGENLEEQQWVTEMGISSSECK